MIIARSPQGSLGSLCLPLVALLSLWIATGQALGQGSDVPVDSEMVESLMKETAPPTPVTKEQPAGIDLLSLITLGGAFMIPIGFMSLLVVTLAVERL